MPRIMRYTGSYYYLTSHTHTRVIGSPDWPLANAETRESSMITTI